MGSELIILYIPLALITLAILLYLARRPSTRWIGLSLLIVSLAAGTWAASAEFSRVAPVTFFSTGFMAGCIFAVPVVYLVRWLIRRFSRAAAS